MKDVYYYHSGRDTLAPPKPAPLTEDDKVRVQAFLAEVQVACEKHRLVIISYGEDGIGITDKTLIDAAPHTDPHAYCYDISTISADGVDDMHWRVAERNR